MLSSPRRVITAIVLGRWMFCRLLEGRCFESGACGYSFIKTFLLTSHPNGCSPFHVIGNHSEGLSTPFKQKVEFRRE